MSLVDKYVFKFVNSNVGPSNYQLVDMDVTPGALDIGFTIAQCIAYFVSLASGIAANTQLSEVQYRAAGSAGATAQPFPTTEYAATVTLAAAGGITLPALSAGYGSALGASDLCPLGTSISVSERTATVGRTGRGRHFLPFIGTDCVDASGHVDAGVIAAMLAAYQIFILGEGTGPLAGISPIGAVVTNSLGTHAGYPILTVKPQPVFSNLESRRR